MRNTNVKEVDDDSDSDIECGQVVTQIENAKGVKNSPIDEVTIGGGTKKGDNGRKMPPTSLREELVNIAHEGITRHNKN